MRIEIEHVSNECRNNQWANEVYSFVWRSRNFQSLSQQKIKHSHERKIAHSSSDGDQYKLSSEF